MITYGTWRTFERCVLGVDVIFLPVWTLVMAVR